LEQNITVELKNTATIHTEENGNKHAVRSITEIQVKRN